MNRFNLKFVSIHAPGRGATWSDRPPLVLYSGFNSRTREGCDKSVRMRSLSMLSFNSRTREGCDLRWVRPPHHEFFQFQFTHPGGVRPSSSLPLHITSLFQFTHPGGVRLTLTGSEFHLLQFQFTHPGGVRLNIYSEVSRAISFQFTHPGGVRPFALRRSASLREFQFTHPGGVRLGEELHPRDGHQSFNSRTREGCD